MEASFPLMHLAFEPEAFALSSYPDSLFWIWTQTDTYLSLSEADLGELRSQGWVEISDDVEPRSNSCALLCPNPIDVNPLYRATWNSTISPLGPF